MHVDGLPKIVKPPMYTCNTCMLTKATKRAMTAKSLQEAVTEYKHQHIYLPSSPLHTPHTPQPLPKTSAPRGEPGTHFQMDMGFVRGTKYQVKDEDGNIITSLDGHNSYLIIIDRATRYTWVFLSKHKHPQIAALTGFLKSHGNTTNTQKSVRTDEGGELWGSYALQQMARELGYILQPTAPDASFQNGVVERPNCTLGDMMRTLLHSANLGPEYWSWALIHAVYLKNWLPHRALGQTPFQAYTGHKPNLKKLWLFGCPVIARLPGKRPAKLGTHAAMGFFLGYTGTDNNVYYQDHLTKRIKISTHVTFDEAGYTLPKAALSNTQIRLQSI